MKATTLGDLQASVQDPLAFATLADYRRITEAFLSFVRRTRPTRIVSPSHPNYIFYQYSEDFGHKVTRPLNANLFIEASRDFRPAFERFITFMSDLKRFGGTAAERRGSQAYIAS